MTRVLDYSKYKYEQAQKQKAARKHQQQITIREIKFRPKIAVGDYATKKGHVERFLKRRDKVKVTIMFRGREVTHPERGQMILDRLAEELADLAIVEQRPNLDGRNMTMMLGPSKAVLAGQYDKDGGQHEGDEADGRGPARRAVRHAGPRGRAAGGRHHGERARPGRGRRRGDRAGRGRGRGERAGRGRGRRRERARCGRGRRHRERARCGRGRRRRRDRSARGRPGAAPRR